MANYSRFKNKWNGQRVDFDHVFGFQCVDEITQYLYDEYGITGVRGNAIDYWTHPSAPLAEHFKPLVGGGDVQQGDIVVLRTAGRTDFAGDGHIGICDHADADNVWLLEQNAAGSGTGTGKDAIGIWRSIPRSRIAGVWRFPRPVAQTASAPVQTAPSGSWVHLPASVASWAAYKVGSGLRKGTPDQVGSLAPAKFGGLDYQIIGWVAGNAVIIDTQSYGRVVIWVKDTDAVISNGPVKVAPAPAPATPKPVYERLGQQLRVQTKYDASLWDLAFNDFADADAHHRIAVLPAKTQFTAVGKATRTDLPERPVYYMSGESFGDADVSGVPAHNQGINTIDLEPQTDNVPKPEKEITETSSEVPATDDEHIDVKVVPTSPDAWQHSYSDEGAGDYEAEADTIVHDLAGKVGDVKLAKGMPIKIAGTFTGPDFIKYRRTVKSVERGDWRGIPTAALKDDDGIFTYLDPLIDDFKEFKGQVSKRKKVIIATAKAHGEFNWLADRLKKKGTK